MVDNIDLVDGHGEGQLVLVEDEAGVQHVAHEGDRGGAADTVNQSEVSI